MSSSDSAAHEVRRRASRLRRRRALPLLAGGLLVATALAGACEQTFEPLGKNDLADFSVFGYLDASADTQWIRVMPIHPLKVTSPGASSDVVTLEEHGTGRTIALRDSPFTFNSNSPSSVSGSARVHNFWTSQPIDPGARYTLSIQRDSGEVATAEITIPPVYHGAVTQPTMASTWRAMGKRPSNTPFRLVRRPT